MLVLVAVHMLGFGALIAMEMRDAAVEAARARGAGADPPSPWIARWVGFLTVSAAVSMLELLVVIGHALVARVGLSRARVLDALAFVASTVFGQGTAAAAAGV